MRALLICSLIGYVFVNGYSQSPHFRMYTIRDGLAQMKANSLLLDNRGYLWVGTRNGLNRFDGEHFKSYTTFEGLLSDRILGLKETRDGTIIILSSGGVQYFDGAEFTSYPHDFPGVKYHMECMEDSTIWILDDRVGAVSKLAQGIFVKVNSFPIISDLIFDRAAAELCVVGSDSLEVLWPDHSRRKESFVMNSFIRLYGDVENNSIMSQTGNPASFYVYQNHTLVPIASFQDGIVSDLQPNGFWMYYKNSLYLPSRDGLRSKISGAFVNVEDVILDPSGQFWIASDNGLGRLYPPVFRHVDNNQLSDVWSVIEDSSGNMWFGTYGNGLLRMFDDGETLARADPEAHIDWREYFLGAVKTPDGALHFANALGVATLLPDGRSEYRRSAPVFTLQYDKQRDAIIEGVYHGINVIQYKDKTKRYWGQEDGVHKNDYIQNVAIDHEGCYWLCSYSGVSRVCPDQRVVNAYSPEIGNLPVHGVFAACEDPNGRLWLGGDRGLMFYDFDETGIHLVHSEVLHEMVKSMLILDSTYLLIAAKTGLYVLNIIEFSRTGIPELRSYNASHGYQGIEPGFNGLYKDSRGEVWITSASGLDILAPEKLDYSPQGLSAMITQIDNQALPFDHNNTSIDLAPGKDQATIYYTAIGMKRPHQTAYQYSLDQAVWSAWESSTQAILTNLSHGRHVFKVRAGPTDSAPESAYFDSIAFDVHLAWYQRAFFLPLVISTIAALFVLMSISLIRQYRARKRYVAQQTEARYLRSQLLLAELNPHFIFNVLASIQNKVLFGRKEEANASVIKLSRLIRNFLDVTYHSNDRQDQEYEIPLSKEIELLQAYIEFEKDKSDGHFDFNIHVEHGISIEHTTIPPMLVQPFVENAIKHGLLPSLTGGMLEIRFRQDKHHLTCEVRDNGVGRDDAKYRAERGFRTHRSLGTQIINERIALLNQLGYHISIQTTDILPSGTEVRIDIAEKE